MLVPLIRGKDGEGTRPLKLQVVGLPQPNGTMRVQITRGEGMDETVGLQLIQAAQKIMQDRLILALREVNEKLQQSRIILPEEFAAIMLKNTGDHQLQQ